MLVEHRLGQPLAARLHVEGLRFAGAELGDLPIVDRDEGGQGRVARPGRAGLAAGDLGRAVAGRPLAAFAPLAAFGRRLRGGRLGPGQRLAAVLDAGRAGPAATAAGLRRG